MEQPSNGQRIDWPEYKGLKVAVIIWVLLLALGAIGFQVWNSLTRDVVETKICSVYFVEITEGDNAWSTTLSTTDCGKLYFSGDPSSERVAFYESLVGEKVEVELFPLQRGNSSGVPVTEESIKRVEA